MKISWKNLERAVKYIRGKDVPMLTKEMESMSDKEREFVADLLEMGKDMLINIEELGRVEIEKLRGALKVTIGDHNLPENIIDDLCNRMLKEIDKISEDI